MDRPHDPAHDAPRTPRKNSASPPDIPPPADTPFTPRIPEKPSPSVRPPVEFVRTSPGNSPSPTRTVPGSPSTADSDPSSDPDTSPPPATSPAPDEHETIQCRSDETPVHDRNKTIDGMQAPTKAEVDHDPFAEAGDSRSLDRPADTVDGAYPNHDRVIVGDAEDDEGDIDDGEACIAFLADAGEPPHADSSGDEIPDATRHNRSNPQPSRIEERLTGESAPLDELAGAPRLDDGGHGEVSDDRPEAGIDETSENVPPRDAEAFRLFNAAMKHSTPEERESLKEKIDVFAELDKGDEKDAAATAIRQDFADIAARAITAVHQQREFQLGLAAWKSDPRIAVPTPGDNPDERRKRHPQVADLLDVVTSILAELGRLMLFHALFPGANVLLLPTDFVEAVSAALTMTNIAGGA